MSTRRIVPVALLALSTLAFALPALAQEEAEAFPTSVNDQITDSVMDPEPESFEAEPMITVPGHYFRADDSLQG